VLAIVAAAAVMTVVMLVFGDWLLGRNRDMVLVLAPILLLSPLSSLFDGIYRGTGRFRALALVTLAGGAAIVPAALLLIGRYGLAGALGAQGLYYGLLCVLFAAGSRGSTAVPSVGVLREVLPYALTLGLSNLAFFLYTRIDVLVLERFGLVVEIGFYVLVYRALDILALPFMIYGQAAAPASTRLFERGDIGRIRTRMGQGLVIVLAGSVLACAAGYFGVPLAIRLVLPDYDVPLVALCMNMLLLLLPVKAWGVFATQGFLVPTGHAGLVLHTTWIGGVVNVALDLALVARYGLPGVVAATLVVHAAVIAAQAILYLRALARIPRPS
jgi:O-antigen/teichoic acid export membrane protein